MTETGTPTPPPSWQLTPAEIEQFAQEAVGQPASPDNSWRPAGGSLLAGVGQCLYDELRGIYDLTALLIQLNADLDIAADGHDNWFFARSAVGDALEVARLYTQLNAGTVRFSTLPYDQQMALFRLYAKMEAIKGVLRNISKAGLNLLAAFDVYWSDYEVFTLNQAENALKALADAISLLFTEQEWASLARAGKDLADRVTELIKNQVQTDPWGSAGYAACLVILFFSPTKVLRAIRPIMNSLGQLSRATTAADLAAILRANRVTVPVWLGGTGEVADAAATARRIEDAVPPAAATDEIIVQGRRPVESANDAAPARAHEPGEQETPPAGGDTTHVAATRRIGDMAEADARARLAAEGYQTFELKNGSGHGPDIIAVRPGNPPQIRVIEVKANSSTLNPLQEMGGPEYLRNVFGRMSQPGQTTWNTADFDRFLRRNGLTRADVENGNFEIWRYKGVDPDNPASVAGGPNTTPWTPGTTGREFRLDAQGNIETRAGPNRQWTPYVEPHE